MSRCPSCGANVAAGETICMECGTELALTAPPPAPEADAAPPEPPSPASEDAAATARVCPDCDEHVRPDLNGLCPVCGHDFQAPVEIDEAEFFREPPSLDEVRARRQAEDIRSRAHPAPLPGDPTAGTRRPAPGATPDPGVAHDTPPTDPAPPMALPGDRLRTRFRPATGEQPVVAEVPYLIVEGGQSVFFDGAMHEQIRLEFDQLLIGRRDPEVGHYPDIDLTHFRHIDAHISRRHARVFREQGRWFVEDLCANDATWLNDRAHPLNGERAELQDGDRVLIERLDIARVLARGRARTVKLRDGFVIGGRYRVDGLVAAGSRFRVYAATSDQGGPGEVIVKVARHDEPPSLEALRAGRRAIANEWESMRFVHDRTSTAVPMPLELVRMYPGDPDVRRAALAERDTVGDEPYLVMQRVAGVPLAQIVRRGWIDEDRALRLALRVALLVRAFARVGLRVERLDAADLFVDATGENLVLVDLGGLSADPAHDPLHDPPLSVEAVGGLELGDDVGRLIVGLLAAAPAPSWPVDDEHRDRWESLLDHRRVPAELRPLLLGVLGYHDAFEATVEAVINRLRAMARARRLTAYTHPRRRRDLDWPLPAGAVLADRFEISGGLAQGGRGFILTARDRDADVDVLVKTNKYVYDSASDFALELPTRRLELVHEYEVMRRFAARTSMLPQPVALVRDDGRGAWFDLAPQRAPDEPYLAMRRLRGRPLLDLLPAPLEGAAGARRDNRLPPAFVMRLVAQLADLLGVFHEDGYLFQDLKPENVVFDATSENLFLVDLAGVCPRDADGRLRRDSVAFGVQTHGFAAPEFADLWERVDARFDLYSLGATAYHLLTGVNPERVALERGEEYPRLDTAPLRGLPTAVVEVVTRCLAPADRRYRSAGEVARAAEAARLWLSRSRPLDVADLRVEYDDDGTSLVWSMPNDPRIRAVRVRVDDAADALYDGPPVEALAVAPDATSEREYVVETVLERSGRTLHSRGRTVRTVARPAPTHFEVRPDFGANRLRVRVPAHATGVRILARAGHPPATPDDGDVLPLSPDPNARGDAADTWTRHPAAAGERVHYAAFALYDDEPSAPRFGDAVALDALPEIAAFEARQDETGIHLHWQPALAGAYVVETVSDRPLEPALGATAIVDDAVERDDEVRYALRVARRGVHSDELAVCALRRWPEPPRLAVAEGPGSVRVDVTDPSPRATGWDLDLAGATERVPADGLPVIRTPEPGERHTVGLCIRLEDDAPGPTSRVDVIVPPRDAGLRVADAELALPARLTVALPAVAATWTGTWTLVVARGDAEVLRWQGHLADRADGTAPSWTVVDEAPAPGSTQRWTARLHAPDGTAIAEVTHAGRVIERLEPPRVAPVLEGVRVDAGEDGDRYDVEVESAGEQHAYPAARLPITVALGAEAVAHVRWRRAVEGDPMPWSAWAQTTTLRRPYAPTKFESTRQGDGSVLLEWRPSADDEVTYRVETDRGRVAYDGPACRVVDPSDDGATRYRIVAVRRGLEALPVEATVGGTEPPPRVHAPSSAPMRLPAGSPLRLGAVAAVRQRTLVEVWAPARPHLCVAIAGDSREGIDAAVADVLRSADEWPRHAAGASVFVAGARRAVGLVAAQADQHLRVIAAPLTAGTPSWRAVGEPVTIVAGTAAGVSVPRAERLRVVPLGEDLDPETIAVVAADARGRLHRIRPTEIEPLAARGAAGGAATLHIGTSLDDAVALGLDATPPAVLVSMVTHETPSDLWRRAWQDAALGWVRFVVRRVARRLRAPLTSERIGAASRADLLVAAEPVAVRFENSRVRDGGRLSLDVLVQARGGGGRRSVVAALADPPDGWGRTVDALVDWIEHTLVTDDAHSEAS